MELFMHKLLSLGEALIDFIPGDTKGSHYLPLPGGAPANVAVAYSKLGGTSFFAGGISNDNFGQLLIGDLVKYGVKTEYVERRPENTALVMITLDDEGERSFDFYRNKTADTQYSLDTMQHINWREMEIMHFCSNTLTTELMYQNTEFALRKAQEAGSLISFDINVREPLWQDKQDLLIKVEKAIEYSNLIKVSKEEAEYLADLAEMPYPAYLQRILGLGPKLIVVTDGANEIKLITEDFITESPVPSIKAVDTTAAGDSFIAGFLKAISEICAKDPSSIKDALISENILKSAAKFGAQCGAITCQSKGAFVALPTAQQVSTLS